jgi:uncharacterized alkaline shock family protein YloU
MSDYHTSGKTTLTPEVLLTIARMAALEVEGVRRMAPVRGGINRLFKRGSDGVQIEIEDNVITIDLYLIVEDDVNLREVGRQVQEHVARAITEMTGLEIGGINIHIEDIEYRRGEG